MSKNLLKEAIADAKAIKETALANARLQMQEAFNPTVKEIISNKIKYEALGNDEVDEDKCEDEEPINEVDDDEDGNEISDDVPVDDEEEVDESTDEITVEGDDETEDKIEDEPVVDEEAPVEGGDESRESLDDLDETDTFDLEEIIKELEDGEDEDDEEVDEPEITDEAEEVDEPVETDDEELEEVKDEVVNISEKDEPEVEEPFEDDTEGGEDEDIDIEEIIRELKGAEEAEKVEDGEKEIKTENVKMKKQVKKLSGELKEHQQVIKYLKSKLNEVNLLNAKLLFTSKLFKSNDLNNGQKMKVVESFDRAKTLREVKLVYTTIAESFKNSKPIVKTKKSVTESIMGGSSKVIPGMSQVTKKKINESVEKSNIESNSNLIIDESSVKRLQKLAGIKILN